MNPTLPGYVPKYTKLDNGLYYKESGIEGNLPLWRGASAVYTKAYLLMAKYGPNTHLIKALGKGDEETIKSILLYTYEGESPKRGINND